MTPAPDLIHYHWCRTCRRWRRHVYALGTALVCAHCQRVLVPSIPSEVA